MRESKEKTRRPNGPLDADRMALRGEFRYRALGEDIIVRHIPGPRVPVWRVKVMMIDQTWQQWQSTMNDIFDQTILYWGELASEDLWRDPEVAFELYGEIVRG